MESLMKYFFLITSVCLAATLLFAATEQWSYTAPAAVYQIVGDGKGGCAFCAADTNDISTVVWLDKKGAEKFVYGPVTPIFMQPTILSCSKKELIFGPPGFPIIAQVDKKGDVQAVAGLTGYLLPTPLVFPFGASQLSDKKGFFVINVNTHSGQNTIVRYSFN